MKTPDPTPPPPPERHEPPPPAKVTLRICARSGLRAGRYCEDVSARTFPETDAPRDHCSRCKAPEREHVSRVAEMEEAKLLRDAEPDYPQELQDQGIQGTVTVRYTVDENGRVTDVSVTHSSGNATLDDSAVRAIKRFRYRPASQNGQPRAVTMTKRFVFRISE